MARRPRLHHPGTVYHVSQRGNNRGPVFLDDVDRLRYVGFLAKLVEAGACRVYTYCLMSNHVHLLLECAETSPSTVMQRLGARYAITFNRRWERCGHVFQGRFDARGVHDDRYLLRVVRYIHLNPVRAGMAPRPEGYRWSGYRAYLGLEAPGWLDPDRVLSALAPRREDAIVEFVRLHGEDDGEGDGGVVPLGGIRVSSGVRTPTPTRIVSLDRVIAAVADGAGLGADELAGRGHRASRARAAVVVLGRELSGARLSELARRLGRDAATLANGAARWTERGGAEWQRILAGVRLGLSAESGEKESLTPSDYRVKSISR